MASASSGARNKKPSWADMVVTGEKPSKDGKDGAKDEPMEAEEEWWHKDWRRKGQSWDEWWEDRRQEWDDWKKSEKEDMAREEKEYQERMEVLADLADKSQVKQELPPGFLHKDKEEDKNEEKSKEEEKLSEDNEEAEEVQPKNQQPPSWKNREWLQQKKGPEGGGWRPRLRRRAWTLAWPGWGPWVAAECGGW